MTHLALAIVDALGTSPKINNQYADVEPYVVVGVSDEYAESLISGMELVRYPPFGKRFEPFLIDLESSDSIIRWEVGGMFAGLLSNSKTPLTMDMVNDVASNSIKVSELVSDSLAKLYEHLDLIIDSNGYIHNMNTLSKNNKKAICESIFDRSMDKFAVILQVALTGDITQ